MEVIYHSTVRSDDADATLPEVCDIRTSIAMAKEIVRLSELVKRENLFKAERFDWLATFKKFDPQHSAEEGSKIGDDNVCTIDMSCLNVSATEWWVSAYERHSSVKMFSERFSVAQLKADFKLNDPATAMVDGENEADGAVEVFQGMFSHDGIWLDLSFQVPHGASQKEKDAAFLAALAQQAEVNYLSVGVIQDGTRSPTPAEESDAITQAEQICERLVDSEEHAVEAAVPEVAFEAAEVIRRLLSTIERQRKFVEEVAGMSIWDYDRDDGTPYKECEEPGDGYLDSHCALMALVEEARKLGGC